MSAAFAIKKEAIWMYDKYGFLFFPVLQAASPRRAAAAAQLPQRVLLLVPRRQLELLVRLVYIVLRPLHVSLDVLDEGALLLHKHENVHEEVPELLHVALQAQQLLRNRTTSGLIHYRGELCGTATSRRDF